MTTIMLYSKLDSKLVSDLLESESSERNFLWETIQKSYPCDMANSDNK